MIKILGITKILFLFGGVLILNTNTIACQGGGSLRQEDLGRLLLKTNYNSISCEYLGQPYSFAGNMAHAGIDYPASTGTSVYAPISGVYNQSSTESATYGYASYILLSNEKKLFFHHMKNRIYGYIAKGQKIGEIFDDHVHVELRANYSGTFLVSGSGGSCRPSTTCTIEQLKNLTGDPSEVVTETTSDSVYFEDNFNDGDTTDWSEGNSEAWSVENGEYKISHSGVDWGFQTHTGDSSWTDYSVQADVICDSGWCDAALHARVQQAGNGQRGNGEFYRFIISAQNREISLQRYGNENVVFLAKSNNFNVGYGEWFSMRLEVKGSYIRCYINNELVAESNDGAYSSGYIGLDMFSNGQARFDNVRCVQNDQAEGHLRIQLPPTQEIDNQIDGTNRNAVVITHGYASNVEAWAIDDTEENGIADKICKDLDPNVILLKTPSGDYTNYMWPRCRTTKWDVFVYDWRTKAKPTPITAYGEAFDQGIHLAEKLADRNYEHVHMLAHSAGSNLINMAKNHLMKIASEMEIHLTFFDAYDPMAQLKCGGQLSDYGKGADFVDNYVDIRTLDKLFIGDLDGTKLFMPNAFNVDVTKWDKRDEPLPPAAILFRHEWPYVFYNEWTFMPMTYDMGYQITLEDGNYKPANREKGKACILSGEGVSGQPVCESIQSVCDLAKHDEDVSTIGDPDIVIGQITESVTGVIDIFNSPTGLLEYWYLETGSPVWSNMELTLNKPVNVLEFNYEFLSDIGAEGYFTIYFDGEVVGHIDERYIGHGKQKSPRFAIGEIEPGYHTLAIRVDPFTNVKSAIKLSSMKLINIQDVQAFHWPMFLPAITGAK